MRFIVDTSVAVKWFVAEDGRSDARLLLGDGISRIAIDLIFVEAANALRKKTKAREIGFDQAQSALTEMKSGFFSDVIPAPDLVSDALALSQSIDHPVPDCCFLAAALSSKAQLVTADDRFADRCADFSSSVVRLRDIAHTLSRSA